MRRCFVCALVVAATGVSLIAAPSTASAAAVVTVTATMTSTPVHWMDDATFSVIVNNPGTDAITDVSVDVSLNTFAIVPVENATSAPTVLVGNDDDVLDPGERWEYTAVAPVFSTMQFDVSGIAPDRSAVTHTQNLQAVGHYPDALLQPVDFVFDVVPQAPAIGEDVEWTVTAANRTAFDVLFLEGRLALLIDPATGESVDPAPLSPPGDSPGGDDVLAVGERWSWTYEHVWESADPPLLIEFHWTRPGILGGLVAFRRSTDPPQVVPTTAPPTTAPPAPATSGPMPTVGGQLPETGAEGSMGMVAALLVLLGLALAVLARRVNPPEV